MGRWVASLACVANSVVADPPVITLSPTTLLPDTDTWQLSNTPLCEVVECYHGVASLVGVANSAVAGSISICQNSTELSSQCD